MDSLLLLGGDHLDRTELLVFLVAVEDKAKRRMLNLVEAIGDQISLADLDEETAINRFYSVEAQLEK